jgi:putative membrane protein
LFRYLNRRRVNPGSGGETLPTPEQLLAERFARGEIDEDEYRRRLDTLRGTGPGARS